MLIESLMIGLLILALRGRIKQYALQVQFKGLWLPIAAFLLEGAAGYGLERISWILPATGLIEAAVYGLLLAFVLLNHQHTGFKLAALGLCLNAAVVFTNGGFMPVEGETLRHFGFFETYDTLKQMKVFGHNLMTQHTRLAILGDVIPIKPPYPMPKSISLGDVILGLGLGLHLALYKGTSDPLMRGGKS